MCLEIDIEIRFRCTGDICKLSVYGFGPDSRVTRRRIYTAISCGSDSAVPRISQSCRKMQFVNHGNNNVIRTRTWRIARISMLSLSPSYFVGDHPSHCLPSVLPPTRSYWLEGKTTGP